MVHLTDKPIFTIVPAEMWMSMHYIHLSIVMMSSAQSGSDERVRILVWNYYSIPSITSLECTSWILIEEVKMMKSKVISFGKEGELTWSDEEISRNLYSDLWIRQADLSIALKRPTATGEKSFLWSYVAVVSVVAVIVVVIWVVPESERICCLFYELTYVLAGHSPRKTEKVIFFQGLNLRTRVRAKQGVVFSMSTGLLSQGWEYLDSIVSVFGIWMSMMTLICITDLHGHQITAVPEDTAA